METRNEGVPPVGAGAEPQWAAPGVSGEYTSECPVWWVRELATRGALKQGDDAGNWMSGKVGIQVGSACICNKGHYRANRVLWLIRVTFRLLLQLEMNNWEINTFGKQEVDDICWNYAIFIHLLWCQFIKSWEAFSRYFYTALTKMAQTGKFGISIKAFVILMGSLPKSKQ